MMAGSLAMENTDKSPRTGDRSGHWIPWVFVGVFALVLVANGTLVVIAISTFTGLETTNAYEKGLAYNDRLAAAAEQKRLQWDVEFAARSQGSANAARLTLELADRMGSPITGAEVEATMKRPVQAGHDLIVRMEEQGNGHYLADVVLPFSGQWDVALTIRARDAIYRRSERVVLPLMEQ